MKSKKQMELLFKILEKAGDCILKIYNKPYSIQIKKDKTKVTEADFLSNSIIIDFLKKKFPYQIISEEIKNSNLSSAKTWVIDPIDGTNDFIKKTGDFSIMLALFEKKKVIFSVIYLPLERTFYYAIKGKGSYKKKVDQSVEMLKLAKKNRKNKQSNIGYISRNHFNKLENTLLQALGIKTLIKMGSIGIKMAKIAEGIGNVYVNISSSLKIWDLAPPALILEEAHGSVVDLLGNPIDYLSLDFRILNGCIATDNQNLTQKVVEKFKQLQ